MARKNREHEIVQVAIELFASKGYEQTSMDDIAAALGILKGSLYHYIESKRDLLAKVLIGGTIELCEGLNQIVESQSSSADKLKQAFRRHVQFFFRRISPSLCYFGGEAYCFTQRTKKKGGKRT
jgi:AcrR family transcriptional regulator